MFSTLRHTGTALALWIVTAVAAGAASEGDAAALFREEIQTAAQRLGSKGPALSDETQFAVAVSGLSWQPSWEGTPLLSRDKKATTYTDGTARFNAYIRARQAKAEKEAFAFAFSVVLDPPSYDAVGRPEAFTYLQKYGEDFDRALLGVMEAPEKLPLLSTYQYRAAEVLMRRATPRLLPFYMTLAQSDDPFLRSRAVMALGILSYHPRSGAHNTLEDLSISLREVSISAVQQRMIADILHRAADEKNVRVRAAAAFALGLRGDEDDLPRLEKLAKDSAYVVYASAKKPTTQDPTSVYFPVQFQAARSLERFGRHVPYRGGRCTDEKSFKETKRGGRDVTKEFNDLRRDQAAPQRPSVQW